MIIDSHCHIDFTQFDTDRDEVLQRALQLGIDKIIVPGVLQNTWQKIELYCLAYPQLYPCYGLHPYYIDRHCENDLELLRNIIQAKSPIAVGECGLDYFLSDLDKDKQQYYFQHQLDIALEFNLPVVIHARKSTQDVINAIKTRAGLRGMIHSYSGSHEQAKQLIDLGFYLSFAGPITYKKSTRLRKLVQSLPLSCLLVETDAPDQPVAEHRNSRNEPAYIIDVIETMATLHHTDTDQIASITSNNANSLFQLV